MTFHLENIEKFINKLDSKTLKILESISVTRTYKKGDFLLQQDQICKNSYFIETGIARKFYLNEGK